MNASVNNSPKKSRTKSAKLSSVCAGIGKGWMVKPLLAAVLPLLLRSTVVMFVPMVRAWAAWCLDILTDVVVNEGLQQKQASAVVQRKPLVVVVEFQIWSHGRSTRCHRPSGSPP